MRPVVLLLAASLAAACLAPMDPSAGPIGSIVATIGGDSARLDTVQVHHTTRVRAVALAPKGYDVGLTGFRFQSSDTHVATVDSLGTVQGVAPGSATIDAIAPRGQHGSVTVVVVPATIAYVIPVGKQPSAIAFGPDFSRAYVAVAP